MAVNRAAEEKAEIEASVLAVLAGLGGKAPPSKIAYATVGEFDDVMVAVEDLVARGALVWTVDRQIAYPPETVKIVYEKEKAMPSVKKVKLSDAPRVVKTPLAKRGLEYDGYVNSVGAGEALRFELGSGETVRAIRSRLYAAARRMEKDIDVWDVDGVVYCALK